MQFTEERQDAPAAVREGWLTEDVLSGTRFSAAGWVFDNRLGLGCVPDAANVAYMGAVVLMKPSVFLALTPPDGIRSAAFISETVDAIGSPYLEIRLGEDEAAPQVREHEGRSRMTAILNTSGDVPVPVCLFFNMNGYLLRAHELDEEVVLSACAGALRERRGPVEDEWVEGPLFEDAMVMVDRKVPTRIIVDGSTVVPRP